MTARKPRAKRLASVQRKQEALSDLREARKQLQEANATTAGGAPATDEDKRSRSLGARLHGIARVIGGFASHFGSNLRSEHTFVSFVAPSGDDEGLTRAQSVQVRRRPRSS